MKTLKQLISSLKNDDSEPIETDLLKYQLSRTNDTKQLKKIARELIENPNYLSDYTILVLKRVLEISPQDLNTIIVLGWTLWMQGEDKYCAHLLNRAKEIDVDNISVMELESALSYEIERKIILFKKIIKQDPENKNAHINLKNLKLAFEANPTINIAYDLPIEYDLSPLIEEW